MRLKIFTLIYQKTGKNSFMDVTFVKIAQIIRRLLFFLPNAASWCIRSLVNLQNLDLSNNRIINVPDILFQSRIKLKVLKLHNNHI